MKRPGRWIAGLIIAVSLTACFVLLMAQKLEIGRLSREIDRLRNDRIALERRIELAGRAEENSAAERVLGTEGRPGEGEASPAASGGVAGDLEVEGKEKTEAGHEVLLEELESLRREVEFWRGLPGETGRLLGILTNAEASAEDRKNAILGLLGQCDVLAHTDKLIEAFQKESSPELLAEMRKVMPELAAKFRSPELADAVLEDLRNQEGGRVEPSATMLGRVYGAEGIDTIRSYLADGSPNVRVAAIQAIGRNLPKSDAVVAALFEAEGSPDPIVRARAAFHLANHGEAYSYAGMIDDWRELTFSMAAEDFGSIGTPAEKIFGQLSRPDVASLMALVSDLGQAHPDANIRHFMTSAYKKLQEDGVLKK